MSVAVICKTKAQWAEAIADAKLCGQGVADWVVQWYGPDDEAQADEIAAGPPMAVSNLDTVGPRAYLVIGYSRSKGPHPATESPPADPT